MKRILLTFILLIFSSAILAKTIVVVGDSLSSGYGFAQEQTWVSLLQQRLNKIKSSWHVINASVSGATSLNAMMLLPDIFQQHNPSILIIEIGGNDGLRGLSLDRLKSNIAAMIVYSRFHGAKILLVGVRLPPNYGAEYTKKLADMYLDLAKTWQVAVVPEILSGVAEDKKNMQPDGLHPTAAAQPLVLKNIWPKLHELLNKF